jgi:YD repeat-containing protein
MGPFGAMDQPKSVTREWNDGFHTLEQAQVSDLMGRPIWAQHPDGSEVYTTVDYSAGMVEEDKVVWDGQSVNIWPEYDQNFFQPAGWTSSTGAAMQLDYGRPDRIDGYDFWRGYGDAGRADYSYHPDGQLHQKTFSYNGTQRYRAAFAYDTLKRVVANDLFDDINNQVVQDEWTYDLLGNFQTMKSGGVGQQWDTAVRFSEPAFIDDGDGNPLELLTWDGQGRLTERVTTNDYYKYGYDGAGRLDNAEVNGGNHYYGYNVDDELIFEDHKSYRVYRFGSYRYASNDKRIIVKPVPQIALITESGKTNSRWMFLEPDGHALESAGDIMGQAGELSFDMLGAYGRTLVSSGDVLPIDGFHGADADPGVGVVPFGVRHVVKDVGIWLQPEPLLYLGLTNGDLTEPRHYSGVYSAGNPIQLEDRTGFNPGAVAPTVGGGGLGAAAAAACSTGGGCVAVGVIAGGYVGTEVGTYVAETDLLGLKTASDAIVGAVIDAGIELGVQAGVLEYVGEAAMGDPAAVEGGGEAAGAAVSAMAGTLQTGGNTLRGGTAAGLNEAFGTDMSRREWGRALERLKEFSGHGNSDHGKILDDGSVLDGAGNEMGNLGDYL